MMGNTARPEFLQQLAMELFHDTVPVSEAKVCQSQGPAYRNQFSYMKNHTEEKKLNDNVKSQRSRGPVAYSRRQ
jgi:hypothetical protein